MGTPTTRGEIREREKRIGENQKGQGEEGGRLDEGAARWPAIQDSVRTAGFINLSRNNL